MKISTIWATGLICLVLGAGIGILAATYLGLDGIPRPAATASPEGGGQGGMMSTPGGPPGGGMMGGPGGGAGGKMGGGRGPSARGQLITLITKLDVLTNAPLSVTLADDQKTAVAEQIKGLEAMNSLPDDEAQKRFDALIEILTNHKDTLVAVGVRWPGGAGPGGGGFQPPSGNPFKDEPNAKVLKALQDRLAAEPAK